MTRTSDIRNSCAVSKFAAIAAVFVCGVAGLLVVALVPVGIEPVAGKQLPEPAPKLPVAAIPVSPDLESLIRFCAENTTSARGFVVLGYGTCVLVPEPTDDPVSRAKEILRNCAEPDARFVTERTVEGDVVVSFRDSVFHRVAAAEIRELEDWSLLNFRALLSPGEKLAAKPGWVPPADARLGLIGRDRLLRDAKRMEIIKVLRPDTSVALGK